MIETRVTVKVDAGPVTAAVDRAARKAFMKFGAFVRVRARTMTGQRGNKKRGAVSDPGQPWNQHTGGFPILFAYDPAIRSFVIGLVPRSRGRSARVIERGGDETIIDRWKRLRAAHFRARPVIGPAFAVELPKLPGMFKDAVKG
jgi:hypothetical protein